jgi:hypothetical protein
MTVVTDYLWFNTNDGENSSPNVDQHGLTGIGLSHDDRGGNQPANQRLQPTAARRQGKKRKQSRRG